MEQDNIIYTYTRQQAIEDGVFVDVSEVARTIGFVIPVVITSSIYYAYIKKDDEQETARRLDAFLLIMYKQIQEQKNKVDNFLKAKVCFDKDKETEVWAVVEGISPVDPRPAMNIMLPEDY